MSSYSETMIWMIEDDISFRDAFISVFELAPGLTCTRAFDSCEDAMAYVHSPAFAESSDRPPEVLLLDINLPGQSGLDGILLLKQALPATRIVMLTIRDEAETIFEAFRRGASGYLPKNAPVEEILDAIHEARRGGTLMPAPVARRVLSLLQEEAPADYDLTDRETQVLREMSTGKSQKQIGVTLFVSPHTVNTHIQHIYEKLHVHSGIQAVAKALRERII